MVLLQTNGVLILDGTEQNLFASQTALKHYGVWVFVHLMVPNDSITFRVYVNDKETPAERKYDEITVSGAQDPPGIFFPFVPTDSFRMTAERTSGVVVSINWVRFDSD